MLPVAGAGQGPPGASGPLHCQCQIVSTAKCSTTCYACIIGAWAALSTICLAPCSKTGSSVTRSQPSPRAWQHSVKPPDIIHQTAINHRVPVVPCSHLVVAQAVVQPVEPLHIAAAACLGGICIVMTAQGSSQMHALATLGTIALLTLLCIRQQWQLYIY
jgi:hypothetical protein